MMHEYLALFVFLSLGAWVGGVVGYWFGLRKGIAAGIQFGFKAKRIKK